MTLPVVDLGAAQALLDAFNGPQPAVTGLKVLELVEAWGILRSPHALDPEVPTGAVFVICPTWPHIQMSIPSMGRLHPDIIDFAISLVNSLKVHIPTTSGAADVRISEPEGRQGQTS